MGGGGVSEDGDPGFQIAPMVDVVFVLLLFFMAFCLFVCVVSAVDGSSWLFGFLEPWFCGSSRC